MAVYVDFPRIGLVIISLILAPFLLIAVMPSLSLGSGWIGGGFGGIWRTLMPYLIPLAVIILILVSIFFKTRR